MGRKRYVLVYRYKDEQGKIMLSIPSEEGITKEEYERRLALFTETLNEFNVELRKKGVEVIHRGVEEV